MSATRFFTAAIAAICLVSNATAEDVTLLSNMTFESFARTMERTIDIEGCQGPALAEIPDIRFAFDSARLQPVAYRQLGLLLEVMADDRHATYLLEGHASADGTAFHNWGLSRRRASSVWDWLVDRGADRNRLKAKWYGETRPLYSEDPEHPHNRRVTFVKIGYNSALFDIAQGQDDLSVKIVVGRNDKEWVLDPRAEPFRTGDHWIACISVARDGYVELFQRGSDAVLESLGTWFVPGGALMKAPTTGAIEVVPPVGNEFLQIRYIQETAECVVARSAQLERLVLSSGRPVARDIRPDKDLGCACDDPSVVCQDVRMRHERP